MSAARYALRVSPSPAEKGRPSRCLTLSLLFVRAICLGASSGWPSNKRLRRSERRRAAFYLVMHLPFCRDQRSPLIREGLILETGWAGRAMRGWPTFLLANSSQTPRPTFSRLCPSSLPPSCPQLLSPTPSPIAV
jgi:hypothetical protein